MQEAFPRHQIRRVSHSKEREAGTKEIKLLFGNCTKQHSHECPLFRRYFASLHILVVHVCVEDGIRRNGISSNSNILIDCRLSGRWGPLALNTRCACRSFECPENRLHLDTEPRV